MTSSGALTQILERIKSFDKVIWDFDGVLSETEVLHQESYRRVASDLCFVPTGDWYTPLIGNTACNNWGTLIECGLEATVADIPQLEARREQLFASLAGAGLRLSNIGEILVFAFDAAGIQQEVLSNGDLSLIAESIGQWGYDGVLHVVERQPDADKLALLEARARPGAITFDDTDRYLRAAEQAGAHAVGVRHSHNSHCVLTNPALNIDDGRDFPVRVANERLQS